MGKRGMLQMLLARTEKTGRVKMIKSGRKIGDIKKVKNAFLSICSSNARTQATFATFHLALPVASHPRGAVPMTLRGSVTISDDCVAPARPTKPAANCAVERRRQGAEKAVQRRRADMRLRRIQKLSAAMGQPVPPDITLGNLLRAEQRHIRKIRLVHQRLASMLGVPLSEIAEIARDR